MKYLKTFKNYGDKPHQFDYVIINDNLDFVSNNIGQIIINKFLYLNGEEELYNYVEYKNVPKNIKRHFHNEYGAMCLLVTNDEITYWSKYKEDLEEILRTKKYNL